MTSLSVFYNERRVWFNPRKDRTWLSFMVYIVKHWKRNLIFFKRKQTDSFVLSLSMVHIWHEHRKTSLLYETLAKRRERLSDIWVERDFSMSSKCQDAFEVYCFIVLQYAFSWVINALMSILPNESAETMGLKLLYDIWNIRKKKS